MRACAAHAAVKAKRGREVSKSAAEWKRAYPLAVCVPWWSGNNAYQIWRDNNPVKRHHWVVGASQSLAWADASRNLKARPDGR